MARKNIVIFPDRDFGIVHDTDEHPDNLNFALHNHDDVYEIILFLGGDCEFAVEGNTYRLRPGDVIFTRPFELHHMTCLSEKTYDRMILYIRSDYFERRSCVEFRDIFENRELGTGNLVVDDISDPALMECMERIYKYSVEGAYDTADHVIYEFLYLLDKEKDSPTQFYTKNECVRDIIVYINDNLSAELSLDMLAERFFVSKHYMCKLFKACTGYTINKYIGMKRVMLVRELHRCGMPLTRACFEGGFNSYANFYKVYVKVMGHAPSVL